MSDLIEIEFLKKMINHHQMALDMANDCLSRAGAKEVTTLCQNIIDAQSTEIARMQAWLSEWYDISYSPMIMPINEMAMGDDYEVAWLAAMIKHHEAAIAMAQQFLVDVRVGEGHTELRNLASQIIKDQSAEIELIRSLVSKRPLIASMEMKTDKSNLTETVNEDGLFNRLWERIEKALPEFMKPQPEPAFTVYKSLNGELRWLATFTNNFIDREGEIISEKAIDGYLNRLEMKLVPMPELWEAHIPETKLGQADNVFAIGNFLHAEGHFDNLPENQRPIEYYRKNAAKISLSHGFTFPKRALKNGVYEEMNSFEVSLLPPPLVASNPFTDLEVNESMKQITPEQEAALAQSRGKEYVDKLIADRLASTKELVEAGIANKDFADVSTTADGDIAAATTTDVVKPLSDLMASVLEDMNELLSTVIGQGKAIKSVMDARAADKVAADDQITALKTEIDKLRVELALTPRRASEARETQVTEAVAKTIIGEAAPDIDPFFS